MPEVSNNAAIFIATSFQAIKRAEEDIPSGAKTINLMIALVFLGFYLEENLDVIINRLHKDYELREFNNGKKQFGLLDKFGWFYNAYLAILKQDRANKSYKETLEENLDNQFPGFKKIHKFRDDVSHGKIEHSLSVAEVSSLRERAKTITDKLLQIVLESEGVSIEKSISYEDAFLNFDRTHPEL